MPAVMTTVGDPPITGKATASRAAKKRALAVRTAAVAAASGEPPRAEARGERGSWVGGEGSGGEGRRWGSNYVTEVAATVAPPPHPDVRREWVSFLSLCQSVLYPPAEI